MDEGGLGFVEVFTDELIPDELGKALQRATIAAQNGPLIGVANDNPIKILRRKRHDLGFQAWRTGLFDHPIPNDDHLKEQIEWIFFVKSLHKDLR